MDLNYVSSLPRTLNLTIDGHGGLGNPNSVNASAILALGQRHTLQVLATVTSSISLAAALCAVFWFTMMQRNFRRDLVLLLILGGSWKSFWFMAFSAVTFADGAIETSDPFCQAGGYCLQVGFEACDVAVFFMSVHMYYQIFPPTSSLLGHDGLYRVRHWVVASWIIFPNLSAGLAFLNPRAAFMAQGAFCSIPLRPFWYRLGLFWIPRYLIWLYIVFVAVRIYRHVGSEFRVFGEEKADVDSTDIPGESAIDRAAQADLERAGSRRASMAHDEHLIRDPSGEHDAEGLRRSTLPTIVDMDSALQLPDSRRSRSLPTTALDPPTVGFDSQATTAVPDAESRHGSVQPAFDVSNEDFANTTTDARRSSIVSTTSHTSSAHAPIDNDNDIPLSPIAENDKTPDTTSPLEKQPTHGTTASQNMRKRRRLIQRQLRLLFIYPVVYLLLWIIPFVVNVMNYTTYYAQNPVFALQVLQVFMLTIMTLVDVVVFCWRERPWSHIPGSDGTFLGSFCWWRYRFEKGWSEGRRASRGVGSMSGVSGNGASRKGTMTDTETGTMTDNTGSMGSPSLRGSAVPDVARVAHEQGQDSGRGFITSLRSSLHRFSHASSRSGSDLNSNINSQLQHHPQSQSQRQISWTSTNTHRTDHTSSTSAPPEAPPSSSRPAPSTILHRPSPHKRIFSATTDRQQRDAVHAHQRLALERADASQRSLQSRIANHSVGNSGNAQLNVNAAGGGRRSGGGGGSADSGRSAVRNGNGSGGGSGRKEWFDRVDEELFRD